MKIEAPKNSNYCAVVVELKDFVELPNCDKLKAAIIFGNSVIVSKDVEVGAIGLFFPVETQLLPDFLTNNNLYRKPEWGNVDAGKTGFFELHGRVRAVRFRGNKSEGFWIPLESLSYLHLPLGELKVGTEFDTLDNRPICKKYVPRYQSSVGSNPKAVRSAREKYRIVDNQFRFHHDTDNLRRNVHKIAPLDWISISEKYHGTSAVFAHILVKRSLAWWENLLLDFGVSIRTEEYQHVWSSRRTIKGVGEKFDEDVKHYYDSDIWNVVLSEVKDRIPKGYTLYGEIVGYMPSGRMIQPGYHYGCEPGKHKFLVYRVTVTNEDGRVVELSWQQMDEFCTSLGLAMVEDWYVGRACDFHNGMEKAQELDLWQKNFLAKLEETYIKNEMCVRNNKKVPAEGIVVRVDHFDHSEAYKLKNYRFLEWETKMLDSGEVDTETVEGGDV